MVLWKVGTLQTPDSLTCALSNHADAGIPGYIDHGALLCRAAARSKRSGRVVASHCSERRNTSDDIDAQGHRSARSHSLLSANIEVAFEVTCATNWIRMRSADRSRTAIIASMPRSSDCGSMLVWLRIAAV
jgi:hypothetical protein